MKTILIGWLVILWTSLSFQAQAQIEITQEFDKSVYAAATEGPEALFKRLSKGDVGKFGIDKDAELPPKTREEGLFLRGFGCFATKEGTVLYKTEGEDANLLPGESYSPKEIFFPAKLGTDLKPGTYLIFFVVQTKNKADADMLRKRPGRSKYVEFTVR